MSKSEQIGRNHLTFDAWARHEFARTGGFTALVILVRIEKLSLAPLRSTWFHVIGNQLDWADTAKLLSSGGVPWDGVVFSTRTDAREGGPVIDLVARNELSELADAIAADRLVVNRNHFFDRWGRRMLVEEVTAQ